MHDYSKMRENTATASVSPPHSPTDSENPSSNADDQRPVHGVVLSRTCSSISQRYTLAVPAVVRRALMMKKSSSPSGYWRIHDTWEFDGDGDAVGNMQQQQHGQQMNPSGKKRGKFLRACRRLLGIKSNKSSSA